MGPSWTWERPRGSLPVLLASQRVDPARPHAFGGGRGQPRTGASGWGAERRGAGSAAAPPRVACGAMVDEEELVRRLRAGDEAAFVALVQQYQARLLRAAETVVVSRSVAEEVVQDTWL